MATKQDIRRLPLPEAGDARCSPAEALATLETHEEFDAAQDRFVRMCKALANPTRVRIVRLLLGVETCVHRDIAERLPLTHSTVSQHLKVLKDAGLIEDTVGGLRTRYGVDREALAEFKALSETLL